MNVVKKGALLIAVAGTVFGVFGAGEKMPFPQQKSFAGCIKPQVPQALMDNDCVQLWYKYKALFMGKNSDGYYFKAAGEGPGGSEGLTISEQHGYAMIITALMAGSDPEAKTIFDGLVEFYDNNRSPINDALMNWVAPGGNGSATDGDLDIAYALILADKQWGGTYLTDAKAIIAAIKEDEYNSSNNRILLGDYYAQSGQNTATRPSDWMADHLRAFKSATGDSEWDQAVTNIYSMISTITNNNSSTTGLMPDFADGSTIAPDGNPPVSGEDNPGDVNGANACRVPWRIAVDYAHSGSADAKKALTKTADWLVKKYATPAKIAQGPYTLSGTTKSADQGAMYCTPFMTTMISDAKYQNYLTNSWSILRNHSGDGTLKDSYNCAIKLMGMLLISGNWWAPSSSASPKPPVLDTTNSIYLDNFDNPFRPGKNGQNTIAEGFGKFKMNESTADSAGGWWAAYGDSYGSKVTNKSDKVLDSTNTGEAVVNGVLEVTMAMSKTIPKNSYGACGLSVPFLKNEGYSNLSKLKSIGIKLKASETNSKGVKTARAYLYLYAITEDIKKITDWGFYGYHLNLPQDKDTTVWINVDYLTKGIDHEFLNDSASYWWNHGAPKVNALNLEVLDSASTVTVALDWIKLAGVSYETFGFTPGPIGITSGQSLAPKAAIRMVNSALELNYIGTGSAVNAVLYNSRGIEVARFNDLAHSSGEHSISINCKYLGLAKGFYAVKLQNGTTGLTQKIALTQ